MHIALALHKAYTAGTPTSAKPASLECGFTTCTELTTTTTNLLAMQINAQICTLAALHFTHYVTVSLAGGNTISTIAKECMISGCG